MMEGILKAVEEYQCPGCVCGSDAECYENKDNYGAQCTRNVCGTTIMPVVGRIYLGMPKGFCRHGKVENQGIQIFKDMEHLKEGWNYGTYNIPVWKYLDEHGNTLIRGLSPRTNNPFLHVILGDHRKEIQCLEITKEEIDGMD